jgi:hypothetical protein
MDQTMRVRNDLNFGFATGVAASSTGLSYIPQLTSPILLAQGPWDAVLVLNALAVKAQQARQSQNAQQAKIVKFNLRILNRYGTRLFLKFLKRGK